MSTATASIREIRTDFRSVKRKIEEHGHVVITDNGVPSFEIKPLQPRPAAKLKPAPMPDYYARVIRRQPRVMTEEETRRFHEENRGDC